VVQTVAMLLLVGAWRGRSAHKLSATPENSAVMQWAVGINLPAVAVVAPLEFAVRESGGAPNSKVRFFGYWLVGALCWYMTGRFADDVAHWRKLRVLARASRADLAFSLIAFPSAILLAAAFGFAGAESRVISLWAILWIAVTSSDLLFRTAQLIKHRRRMTVR
jgi:hypothetical protein